MKYRHTPKVLDIILQSFWRLQYKDRRPLGIATHSCYCILFLRLHSTLWYNISIVSIKADSADLIMAVDMGRLTEKPNRYPIFLKTDTDTDFGILKTEKYRIPTKNNRKNRCSRLFCYLPKLLFCLCFTTECASATICVGWVINKLVSVVHH